MQGFCPLASGSKGNSIYLETEKTKILIDAGLSFKELKRRLSEISIDISQIDADLITHEHMDHIEALKGINEHTNIPVFCNSETAKGIYQNLRFLPKCKIFSSDESFAFQDLIIQPFSIQHDTLDPVGFLIYYKSLELGKSFKLGFCTDLGIATTSVKKHLEGCNYLYLEANHELNMLMASNRPEMLKRRISSRQGHLSNEETFNLLASLLHSDLKHIFLAHLSADCNSHELLTDRMGAFLEKHKSSAGFGLAWQKKVSEFIKFS